MAGWASSIIAVVITAAYLEASQRAASSIIAAHLGHLEVGQGASSSVTVDYFLNPEVSQGATSYRGWSEGLLYYHHCPFGEPRS